MFQVRPEAPEFEVWVEPLDSVQGVLAGTGAGACAFVFWTLDICYRERRCEELRIFSCVGLQDIGALRVKLQAHKCHAALLDTRRGAEGNQSRSEAARVQLDPSEYCGKSPMSPLLLYVPLIQCCPLVERFTPPPNLRLDSSMCVIAQYSRHPSDPDESPPLLFPSFSH